MTSGEFLAMVIPAAILKQALELYLQNAYPTGDADSLAFAPAPPLTLPPAIQARIARIRALPDHAPVPLDALEKDTTITVGSYVLRLGQPLYPFMKLAVDPIPEGERCCGLDFLLRVDAHDRHLHAPPDSPDAAWLTSIRLSNKQVADRIDAAWEAARLPTFKEFLRRQLEQRRGRAAGIPAGPRATP